MAWTLSATWWRTAPTSKPGMTTKARLNNTSFDELGATPFVLAALVADADLMRVLVEVGADPADPNR